MAFAYHQIKQYYCIVSVVLGCSVFVKAQNIYGVSGAIKTPNAYTVKSGRINIGGAYSFDYFNYPLAPKNKQIENYSFFGNIGFHSRVDAGIRIIGFPDVKVNTSTYQGAYVDRNVSAKIVCLKEKEFIPQLSIGVQDAVGTRFFHGSYVVTSKNIKLGTTMYFEPSIGYGFVFPSKVLAVNDYKLKRFFGSIVFNPRKGLKIFYEYDSRDNNIGVQYGYKEMLYLQVNYLGLTYISSTFFVSFKL